MPSNLSNMSIEDIQLHTSQQQQLQIGQGINPMFNNGALNAGRGTNKTVAQQIFSHLDMQQLAYLMLVQQHITQSKQFQEQQQRGRDKERKGDGADGGDKGDESTSDEDSDDVSEMDTDELQEELKKFGSGGHDGIYALWTISLSLCVLCCDLRLDEDGMWHFDCVRVDDKRYCLMNNKRTRI